MIICLSHLTSALLTAHLEQHAFSSWIWYRQLSDGHAFLLQWSFPSCDERISTAILIFKVIIKFSLSNIRCIYFFITYFAFACYTIYFPIWKDTWMPNSTVLIHSTANSASACIKYILLCSNLRTIIEFIVFNNLFWFWWRWVLTYLLKT